MNMDAGEKIIESKIRWVQKAKPGPKPLPKFVINRMAADDGIRGEMRFITANDPIFRPDDEQEGTVRLEVRCPRLPAAMRTLNTFSYVRDATIFADSLHALVDAGGEKRVAGDLAAAGFESPTTVPILPTLEDVFVTITRVRSETRHV